MAKISRARQARRNAQAVIDNPSSSAKDVRDAKETRKSTGRILRATKETKGKSLADIGELRTGAMEERSGAVGSAAKIEEANIARAYSDAMRMLTGRQKAQGTRYTGPGVQGLVGDEPQITESAYTSRYMDPGTTKYQDVNLERMLGFEGSISDRRKEFRNLWGEPGTQQYANMQDWQSQQLAGGDSPTPKWLTDEDLNNLNNTNLNNLNFNTLNRTQGTSAFQHPYAADAYSVPNMQTGGAWEGLGAEYQPGTKEGLGLLAGDTYTGYQPLASGLLEAAPAYNQTGGIFESVSNKPGVTAGLGGQFIGYPNPDGSTSSDSWSPTWQFTNVNGAQQYGYFNQGGQWVRGGDQSS